MPDITNSEPPMKAKRNKKGPVIELGILPSHGFLREGQVLGIFPFSRATLWNRVKAGTFPAPVNIAARCTAWAAEDLRAEYERLRQMPRTPA
jgi:prophage regulatory protein